MKIYKKLDLLQALFVSTQREREREKERAVATTERSTSGVHTVLVYQFVNSDNNYLLVKRTRYISSVIQNVEVQYIIVVQ